ncbi:MAG: UDP-N-acetylmuramoyl-L-alanine--D-glutamate ligase [Clostridia bacterium]|nr:UDP-N-acetylmuramoyl-L-alanine--D-glutamate ligase [Clostridia bacterium]
MNNPSLQAFIDSLAGKTVAVCGIGKNNTPVVRQFLGYGAHVRACDKRDREALGAVADELEAAGAELCLGESYLDRLNDCDLVLRTPGMKPYLPPFEAARALGVPVTSEMELFFTYCPAPIYAVTGSDGKTTTTTIIANLLEKSGKRVWLGGNIGRALFPLIEQVEADDVVVVELSSFQLTYMTQSPHVAVVTNVSPNHLDWHTDMAEYVDAKKNLITHQKSGARCVLNADNAVTAAFAEEISDRQLLTFSRQSHPTNGAWMDGDTLTVSFGGVDTPILKADEIKLAGTFNLENYMAAFCAVWGEVSPADMAAFAREFGGVEHRRELTRVRRGVEWYNDSIGSSPSRTIAGLGSFDRKVILIAGGYDKNTPYEPLGATAADTVKTAILLGATADKIHQAIRTYSDLPIVRVESLEQAVAVADDLSVDGDVVFFSPASASFDMYKNFEERGQHFKSLVAALDE